jgi:Ca2+/Na+ antiporter
LNSAELRYPRQTLWADYLRAAAGVLLCGAPLLLLQINRWVAYVLVAGFLLFALFLVRTAVRHQTRYVLGPDTLCADGPAGTLVEWVRLDRLKLSYYSTKRDRSGGWMQLSIGSTGGRLVKVDSSLDGFHDIVERAARAAEAAGIDLSEATRTNLRAMGILVAGQEELA